MLPRKQKSLRIWGPLIKGAIVFEGLFFLGSYWIYRRLNRDRDFRYYCHNNLNFAVEAYYSFIERIDSNAGAVRQLDYEAWGIGTPNNPRKQ